MINSKFKFLAMIAGLILTFTACQVDDPPTLVGNYEANVVRLAGPFNLSIYENYGSVVTIEAPFDGDIWSTVQADYKEHDRQYYDIHFAPQFIGPNIELWGDGTYQNGTLQLYYSIDFAGHIYDFKIIGSK